MPDVDQLAAILAEAKRIADGLQFACRLPDKTPDFTACGGPAAEAYWDYFTPARISSLLTAVEAVLTGTGTLGAESARFGKIADDASSGSAVEVSALAASQAYDRSARMLLEAITAALTGEAGNDG